MDNFFDTHAHLTNHQEFPEYYCLNVTTQRIEWQQALNVYQNYPNILPALGIHPWFVDGIDDSSITSLTALIERHKVFALGEIGLDFSSHYSSTRNLQISIFEQQLSLAKFYQLPISVHCQKAQNVLLNLLKQYDLGKTGVLHGFVSSPQMVSDFLDIGYKIGINGVICRSNARRYHEMVRTFGIENFVLETDFPNILLPDNDSCNLQDISLIARQTANLLNLNLDEVVRITAENAHNIFLR